MAHKEVYYLGAHPKCLVDVKPDQKPDGTKPQTMFHECISPDGTQCISQARFDSGFTPVGYTQLSYDDAKAQSTAWTKEREK